MRFDHEPLEVVVGAVSGLDAVVVAHVIAMVAGRCGHRHEPDAARAEPLDIVELPGETVQVADAVAVRVVERADEDLVADGAAGPGGRLLSGQRRGSYDGDAHAKRAYD